MRCIICKKPLGLNASLKNKRACKKHTPILLNHLGEGEEFSSVSFVKDGVEHPVNSLGEYEKAYHTGLIMLRA